MAPYIDHDAPLTASTLEFTLCARHLRLWLAAAGLTYGLQAREMFVRAHPSLFGRAFEVPLRGYEQWQRRQAAPDDLDRFAQYLARRHQRWLVAHGATTGLPPCLLGVGVDRHCWKLPAADSAPRSDLDAAA